MAICSLCGKPAGLFRKVHPECEKAYESGKESISSLTSGLLTDATPLNELVSKTKEIAVAFHIKDDERHTLELRGWEAAINDALLDGVLSEAQDQRLTEAKAAFRLSDYEVQNDDNGISFSKIAKSAALRDLMSGVIPSRMKIDPNLPINFEKDEKVVWAFNNCNYCEYKTHRNTVGTSHGFNMRVMKGLYYDTREFESHQIEREELVRVAVGLLVLTDKHIYFAGPSKAFRVPYKKIVSFEYYKEGVGIMRDAANAKIQIFINDDGWFTCNLVTNLARLAK